MTMSQRAAAQGTSTGRPVGAGGMQEVTHLLTETDLGERYSHDILSVKKNNFSSFPKTSSVVNFFKKKLFFRAHEEHFEKRVARGPLPFCHSPWR